MSAHPAPFAYLPVYPGDHVIYNVTFRAVSFVHGRLEDVQEMARCAIITHVGLAQCKHITPSGQWVMPKYLVKPMPSDQLNTEVYEVLTLQRDGVTTSYRATVRIRELENPKGQPYGQILLAQAQVYDKTLLPEPPLFRHRRLSLRPPDRQPPKGLPVFLRQLTNAHRAPQCIHTYIVSKGA